MNQLPKRSETSPDHRWKLEDLFADKGAWEQEYAVAKQLLNQIGQYEGKLADPGKLKECFELEDELSLHVERLYVYANMRHHEDTAEPANMALSDKSKKLSVETGEALSFITPEVLSLPDDQLDKLIDNPELAKYRFTLSRCAAKRRMYFRRPRKRCLPKRATSVRRLAPFSAC